MDWGTWPPTNIDYNAAYASELNLSKADLSNAFNYSNYTTISNFTNVSLTNSSQSAKAIAAPYNEIIVAQVFGYWAPILIIFFISILVYAKTESLGAVSLTILLLSSLILGNSAAGIWSIPPEVCNILYLMAGLTLAGSLISWIVARNN
jgi:hypothetical protein